MTYNRFFQAQISLLYWITVVLVKFYTAYIFCQNLYFLITTMKKKKHFIGKFYYELQGRVFDNNNNIINLI